jgi:hypothetical protein
MRAMSTEGPGWQGLVQTRSGIVPIRDKPAQVEVVVVDESPGAEGIRANQVEPRPKDATDGDASAPGPPTCRPRLPTRGKWSHILSGLVLKKGRVLPEFLWSFSGSLSPPSLCFHVAFSLRHR